MFGPIQRSHRGTLSFSMDLLVLLFGSESVQAKLVWLAVLANSSSPSKHYFVPTRLANEWLSELQFGNRRAGDLVCNSQ